MMHGAHGDMPPFIPDPEPGDPGMAVLRKIKAPDVAVYLPDHRGKVSVRVARNPDPGGSFGFIGRFVSISTKTAGNAYPSGTLVISFSPARLGSVALETLRVFLWNTEEREYQLVEQSGVGQTRDYVWARVARPGLYTVIGVDADPLVLQTLELLRDLQPWAEGRQQAKMPFRSRVCQLILCRPDLQKRAADPRFARRIVERNLRRGMPGRFPGGRPPRVSPRRRRSVCEICRGGRTPAEIGILPTTCETTRHRSGLWEVLESDSQILAVHAAMLPTGKVLYFSGSEHDEGQNTAGAIDHTRTWDPGTGTIERLGSPPYDLFCAGHSLLGDGRLLAAGGTERWGSGVAAGEHGLYGHFSGLRDAAIFDSGTLPPANPWTVGPEMNSERGLATGGGRWYPTLVTLGDGRVLTVAGHPEEADTRHNNIMVEIFDPAGAGGGAWLDVGDQPLIPWGYPRMHLLPDGRVFFTRLEDTNSWTWEAPNAWTQVAGGPGSEYVGYDTSSVLLPLMPGDGYTAKVLVVGGTDARVIQPGAAAAAWQTTLRTLTGSPVRRHAIATLLADGTVLVSGGSQSSLDANAVLQAEVFDPFRQTWFVTATSAVPRLYHSVALLLPDGRVWTAGSNFNCSSGLANRELRMEIYSPPYLFRGRRPTISAAPASVPLASTLSIETPQASEVSSVALVRCGSVTHAFNADQRYIGLSITARSSTDLTVATPPKSNVAPPGYYMLFIINSVGAPSVAHILRVG